MQTTKIFDAYWSQRPHALSRLAFWTMTNNLFLMFALFIAAGEANGHEFEDGFVERSVAVVVRDKVARLEYSIGLNPNTRQQLIKFWLSSDDNAGEIRGNSGRKTDLIQEKVDFFQLAADHLGRRLDIVVNNQPVEPKLISSLQSSRHHVDVTVIIEFNLPASDGQIPIAIEIADGNFFRATAVQENIAPATQKTSSVAKPEKRMRDEPYLSPAPFGGGFRYAFKTAGSAVLSNSNVASILIRADRHLDENFTDEQLDHAFKIKAKVSNISGTTTKQRR